MIVLQLIGPTGVGKSHWGKWLAEDINQKVQEPDLFFYDLDHLIETPTDTAEAIFLNHGPHSFFERSLQALERLAQSSRRCVVATGAGTQWAACHLGLQEHLLAFPTCTLWCTPTVLLTHLQSKRCDPRSLEALQNTEYSLERTALYEQSAYHIDRTWLSEQQLKVALKAMYLKMINY